MPHQCLKCGRTFDEGSHQLLQGCLDCGGNRFFFTKEPLTPEQRNTIAQTMNKDITTHLMDVLAEKNKDIVFIKSGKWIPIKPQEIRQIIEEKINTLEQKKFQKEEPIPAVNAPEIKTPIEQTVPEKENIESPETIDIEQPGKYNIDVKGLLEKEPIIIQKDGVYTIHLPSVFKMINDKKKK